MLHRCLRFLWHRLGTASFQWLGICPEAALPPVSLPLQVCPAQLLQAPHEVPFCMACITRPQQASLQFCLLDTEDFEIGMVYLDCRVLVMLLMMLLAENVCCDSCSCCCCETAAVKVVSWCVGATVGFRQNLSIPQTEQVVACFHPAHVAWPPDVHVFAVGWTCMWEWSLVVAANLHVREGDLLGRPVAHRVC